MRCGQKNVETLQCVKHHALQLMLWISVCWSAIVGYINPSAVLGIYAFQTEQAQANQEPIRSIK